MTELSVRVLTEDDWELYKTHRLASLKESPDAFAADHETEAGYADTEWQARMRRATRLLAERGGEHVGVASVRSQEPREGTDDQMVEFFGMWVHPRHRGEGIGAELVSAAAAIARSMDMRHLSYWVGTDNGPAVAFASAYGFRVTDTRRPMAVRGEEPEDDAEDEMMMILPLADDPGAVASTAVR